MTNRRQKLATLAAAAALLAGSGCGSEDEEPGPGIPAQTAERLSRELDLVKERIDVTREQSKPGACGDIESKSHPTIENILDGLPDDTDPDVRRALEQSVDRLKELAEAECAELIEEIESRPDETTPQEVTPPPPAPPPPETTPPETETEPREDEDEKPKEEKEEQREGGGRGPDGQGPPGQGGGGQPAPPAEDG